MTNVRIIVAVVVALVVPYAMPTRDASASPPGAISFAVTGRIVQPTTALVVGPSGLPTVLSFTIRDTDGLFRAIVCKRPNLGVCAAVDSTKAGRVVIVHGTVDNFGSCYAQLSATEVGFF